MNNTRLAGLSASRGILFPLPVSLQKCRDYRCVLSVYLLTCVLGIQTQVLMLVQQALYLLNLFSILFLRWSHTAKTDLELLTLLLPPQNC